MGISGNEEADAAAKPAINAPIYSDKIIVKDYICLIKQIVKEKWQKQWEEENNTNKLKQIKPLIALWNSSNQKDKKAEVILTRLRIGHTRITHGFLMSTPHGDIPKCNDCNTVLTVKHILYECRSFTQQRMLYFGHKTLLEILSDSEKFSMSQILKFLRSTKMVDKI